MVLPSPEASEKMFENVNDGGWRMAMPVYPISYPGSSGSEELEKPRRVKTI